MIKNLSDILVVSDLDGTLLTAKTGIPTSNLETIKLFTSLGGKFSVATGRSVQSARPHIEKLSPQLPVILYNGGVIYDYKTEKTICYRALDIRKAQKAIDDILKVFPYIGVEIMAENFKTYLVNANEFTYEHLSRENMEFVACSAENVPENWFKVFLTCNKNDMEVLKVFLSKKNYGEICFSQTGEFYLEMLPKSINKGVALKKLCKILNHPIENTVGIGDFDNDEELIEFAGTGVAVENATDALKQKADIVTQSCLNGGVAQVLYDLIKKYT